MQKVVFILVTLVIEYNGSYLPSVCGHNEALDSISYGVLFYSPDILHKMHEQCN